MTTVLRGIYGSSDNKPDDIWLRVRTIADREIEINVVGEDGLLRKFLLDICIEGGKFKVVRYGGIDPAYGFQVDEKGRVLFEIDE